MASVKKRTWVHNGEKKTAWVVRYTDGEGQRHLKTFQRMKEADAYRTKVETELEGGVHIARSMSKTFSEACEAWIADCERRCKIGDDITPATLDLYRRNARIHVLPRFGNVLLVDIDHLMVQDWVNDKRDALAWNRVNNISIVVRSVLRFALVRKWIKVNPIADRGLRIPGEKQKEKPIPRKDEIRTLLNVISRRLPGMYEHTYANRLTVVVLAMFCGMRRGEIAALKWENVDFERGAIDVKHSLCRYAGIKGPKTKAGIRTVPMPTPVRRVLYWMRSLARSQRSPFVVHARGGENINPGSVWHLFTNALRAAELGPMEEGGPPRYNFHQLRHVAASLLVEEGADALVLTKFIGHAKPSVTLNIYAHLFADDKRGAEAIEEASRQFPLPVPRLSRRQDGDNGLQAPGK